MKKIFNISTIISTGILNFIKAADKGIPEKNIFIYVDGVEYKAKESDNEIVNEDNNESVNNFLKKRINNDTLYNDIINSLEKKNIIYDKFNSDSINDQGEEICNLFFFKRIEIDNSKITINNAKIGKKNTIQSLEILKMELKDIENSKNPHSNNSSSKSRSIYIYLRINLDIADDNLIVSYKIDGNETKIDDFITIDDLEKIYKAISERKQVNITTKHTNDKNYMFTDNYIINSEKISYDKFKNINDLFLNKYSTIYVLSDDELKKYLKEKLAINGKITINKNLDHDSNEYLITLPDKYLLCRVNLSLIPEKEIKGKTLKYDYLNQLELNYFTIYPKGTMYSELDKYIKNQFKFLKDKKYSLYYDYDSAPDSLNIKINNDNEIEPGEITICIDDNENNNDLYEAINDNIKTVKIHIFRNNYYFLLENVKNNNIIELLGKIIKSRENKIIDDFNLEFFNSKKEKLEIENNNKDLNKDFYTSENLIEINVNIKELKNNKEDKKDDKDKDKDKDKGGTGQGNNTTQSTEGDVKKEKKCCCGCK